MSGYRCHGNVGGDDTGTAAGAAAHKSCDVGYNRPSSNVSVLVLHSGQARNATAQLRAMGVFETVGELDASRSIIRRTFTLLGRASVG